MTQIVFDDFADGDYTSNPVWTVEAGGFTVTGNALKHNNVVFSALNTPASFNESSLTMSFDVNADNNTDEYRLWISTTSSYTDGDGYYVHVNVNGASSSISLHREDGGSETQIRTASVTMNTGTSYEVKAVRSGSDWQLYLDGSPVGATVTDNTYTSFSYAIVSMDGAGSSFAGTMDNITVEIPVSQDLSESITITDTLVIEPGKSLAESITITDTLTMSPGQINLSEAITITDSLIVSPGQVGLNEAITITDTLDAHLVELATINGRANIGLEPDIYINGVLYTDHIPKYTWKERLNEVPSMSSELFNILSADKTNIAEGNTVSIKMGDKLIFPVNEIEQSTYSSDEYGAISGMGRVSRILKDYKVMKTASADSDSTNDQPQWTNTALSTIISEQIASGTGLTLGQNDVSKLITIHSDNDNALSFLVGGTTDIAGEEWYESGSSGDTFNATTERGGLVVTDFTEYSDDANTLFLYHFEEGTGSGVNDSGSNNRDLTWQGTAQWFETTIAGSYAIGVFSDTNYLKSGDFAVTAANGTFECLIYPLSVPTGSILATFVNQLDTGESTDYLLSYIDANGKINFQLDKASATPILKSTTIVSPNHWYHVMVTWDGTDHKLYINGTEEDSETSSAGLDSSTRRWWFGRPNEAGESFNGYLDEVRLSDSVRSAITPTVYTFNISGASQNCLNVNNQADYDNLSNSVLALGYGDGQNQLKSYIDHATTNRDFLTVAIDENDTTLTLDDTSLFKTPASTTLNGAINATVTTITLTDASSFGEQGTAKIESEQINYTAKSGNNLTGCTRGANGTTAATHADTTATTELPNVWIGMELVNYAGKSGKTLTTVTRSLTGSNAGPFQTNGSTYYVTTGTNGYPHAVDIPVWDAQYDIDNPQSGSSISDNDLKEVTIKDLTIIDQNALDFAAASYLSEHKDLLRRINLTPADYLDALKKVDVGDTVKIVDSDAGLNENYRLVGKTYTFDYGNNILDFEFGNFPLKFIDEVKSAKDESTNLSKYMQGAVNIDSVSTIDNLEAEGSPTGNPAPGALDLYFNISTDAVAINKVLLSYRLQAPKVWSTVTTNPTGQLINFLSTSFSGVSISDAPTTVKSMTIPSNDMEKFTLHVVFHYFSENTPVVTMSWYLHDTTAGVLYPNSAEQPTAPGNQLDVRLATSTAGVSTDTMTLVFELPGQTAGNTVVLKAITGGGTHTFRGTINGWGHPINKTLSSYDLQTTAYGATDTRIFYTNDASTSPTWTEITSALETTYGTLASGNNTTESDLDITSYFKNTGWKGIRIVTDGDARCFASIQTKVYVQSK